MATPAPKLTASIVNSPYSWEHDKITVGRTADECIPQQLAVSFQRSIRVSDDGKVNNLPPGLGHFPLYNVSGFAETMPQTMLSKGGYFFPMYQREAMWISFRSDSPFAIKVLIGGVNAVSGEAVLETPEVLKRRAIMLEEKRSIQDYVVSPEQLWLDGIASTDGTVRQFVAVPVGTGYTVEAQITGEDLVGGIQFEVTPSKLKAMPKPPPGHFPINVRTMHNKMLKVIVSPSHTTDNVKCLIEDQIGMPVNLQRLIFAGKQMEDGRTISHYNIQKDCTVHLGERLRGGGADPDSEMGIAAGGKIKQTIIKDPYDPSSWDPSSGITFNVQMLNSAVFEKVTGKPAPTTPVTAETYAEHGLPYFDIYNEENSGIKGDFQGVKSVNEKDMEGEATAEKLQAIKEVTNIAENPVIMLDKGGKRVEFRPVKVMEQEVREAHIRMEI